MESLSLKFTLALGQARPTQRRTGQGQARPISSPTIQWNVPGICDAHRTGLCARVCVCARVYKDKSNKKEKENKNKTEKERTEKPN